MIIDTSITYNVVASEPPEEAVTEVAKALPAQAVKDEDRQSVTSQEPKETKSTEPVTKEEVVKAASEIELHLKSLATDLKFEVDAVEHDVVVKVLDPETNEVIRQIPSEEIIAIRDKIEKIHQQVGVLHDVRT